MKEKYGSHLKLIDAFRLHRALSVFGMFSVSTGVVDHEANQRVLGLLLKIKKKRCNLGCAREDRSGLVMKDWGRNSVCQRVQTSRRA